MKTASMTQQQKRDKAAELLGWKREESPFTRHGLTITTVTNRVWWHPDIAGCSSMEPLYDEDLNLMHEAEKVLTEDQQDKYQTMLTNLVSGEPINAYCHWSDVGSTFTVHATAAQRLDAWLEVMMEGETAAPEQADVGIPRTATEGRENLERIQKLRRQIIEKMESLVRESCSSKLHIP